MTFTRVGGAVALVALLALAGCSGSGPGTVTATFDDGAEGWTVAGDAQDGEAAPTHVAAGGSSGGHLEAADDVTGGVWYWNASGEFLGDRSAYLDGTLSFSLRQSATDDQFDGWDVILDDGDVRLGYRFADGPPGTNWTRYEVPVAAEGWTNVDTDDPATESEFEGVVSDLELLWIRGEYRTGSDTGGIDEVELAP